MVCFCYIYHNVMKQCFDIFFKSRKPDSLCNQSRVKLLSPLYSCWQNVLRAFITSNRSMNTISYSWFALLGFKVMFLSVESIRAILTAYVFHLVVCIMFNRPNHLPMQTEFLPYHWVACTVPRAKNKTLSWGNGISTKKLRLQYRLGIFIRTSDIKVSNLFWLIMEILNSITVSTFV